ncbi:MAG: 2-C-methyl-D-erythritol 4-phosphate cytidylyltransferase [Candidatus Dormibacteraeota bacterium]|uniref:2-C-methyl-D-erythritol 4-phosphate cytidylyltransferase n=1 Tax=Candidatus Dormiibacter inghamiae TaxID=3127013 RepID=A0A934KMD2_9BACT|nr:2-C-methyl-D-erythritol 4-phosphate cytidylyltransferase [Candidatus Dormibacteraeota bacterium]MBJ7605138.1 2-C-methyl-D-erythritol 4-phosphate cytidylyltransferase [Candidatus Dormibacteraeota bacterium]
MTTPAQRPGEGRVGVVVAAAGFGARLGRGSKALLELNGRTLLRRALERCCQLAEVDELVLVVPPAQLELARRESERVGCSKPVTVVPGGQTRQQSVKLGLEALSVCEWVLVHDAARPLASAELFRRVLNATRASGAAVPGLTPRDAVKRLVGDHAAETLDRSQLLVVQTPQGFARATLQRAHAQTAASGFSADDDAELVRAVGQEVAVVLGEVANVKLTTEEDLAVLEALLAAREAPAPR